MGSKWKEKGRKTEKEEKLKGKKGVGRGGEERKGMGKGGRGQLGKEEDARSNL